MFNIFYCELLKLKRCFLVWVMLLVIFLFNVIYCIGRLREGTGFIKWEHYLINQQGILFIFLGSIFFSVIAAHIISREYTEKTAANLYTYNISRIKIFIGKFLAVAMVVVLIYVFDLLTMIGMGMILKHEPLSMEILEYIIKISIESMVFQFALIPVWILIGNLSKNVSIPAILGSVIAVSNMIFMDMKDTVYYKYSPFTLPSRSMIALSRTKQFSYCSTEDILFGIVTFLVFFVVCSIYYKKVDVY